MAVPTLYQEARINVEPTSPNSILSINTSKGSIFSAGRKRPHDEISGLDEENYAKRHLASEASVFFRRKSRSPRSFLWRVLDDRQLLEIQCVDLVQEQKHAQESLLTFTITFPAAIVPCGAAFADPDEHDALEVFVLTTANELYTFSLRRDLLTREKPPADFESSACFKKHQSTALSFRHPYRLVALSAHELLISLHDGGLMRLDRNTGDNGSHWRETFFSEGGWGTSLRGLISFRQHNTVQYGNLSLEPGSAAAIAASPDGGHVWTVSLDHTLKAWNTRTGKVGAQIDLHGERQSDSQKQQSQYLMSATQGILLRVVTAQGQSDALAKMDGSTPYFLVTRSPKDHQFKFWAVINADSPEGGLQDMLPGEKLIPPFDELMNSNIWHLEEFFIKLGSGSTNTQIWLRARSGTFCNTFHLAFDMDDRGSVAEAWQDDWTVVNPGPQTPEKLRDCADYPGDLDAQTMSAGPVTPTERWLRFLLYPSRFTTASLETALHIYKKGRGLRSPISSNETPLQERLVTAISSKIVMRRLPGDEPDFTRYQQDIQAQWIVYYGLVKHLHQRRGESVGLAYDEEEELAWSILADCVCPIRKSTDLELLLHNQSLLETETSISETVSAQVHPTDESVYVAQILKAAGAFRRSFPDSFNAAFLTLVASDALLDSNEDLGTRLQALYDRCGIASEVADEDFENLTRTMEDMGGLGSLDNDGVLAVIEHLQEKQQGGDGHLKLTRYGDKVNIGGVQEMLRLGQGVLLDLLVLVVFMAADLEPEELSPTFYAGQLYDILLSRIRQHELLTWLASHIREEPRIHRRRTSVQAEEARAAAAIPPSPIALTLYESNFIGDWHSSMPEGFAMPELLTHWILNWTYGMDLYQSWDGITTHILANLIKHEDYELATDFLRFVPEDSWAAYLKGRLSLATGNYALAAQDFKLAAEELAQNVQNLRGKSFDTASLLDATERASFTDGQYRYYQHICSLFERIKVYSYTADFAALALEYLGREDGFNEGSLMEIDKKKGSMQGSPAADRIDLAMDEIRLLRLQEVREEILGRLFSALVQTGRFVDAYDAVSKLSNPALRKASLQTLIQSMITHEATSLLLTLPFSIETAADADAILLSLARKTLTNSVSTSQPPYIQILYAWRVQRNNFRGAAEILHERLERLRTAGKAIQDPEDETLMHAYTLLINTLVCCGEEDGWILAEGIAGVNEGKAKRRLVTLADIRREYSAELDRRSEMLQGRFALVGGDEMDVL